MPCYDERDNPRYIEINEVQPLRNRINKLEAMLCGVMSFLETTNRFGNIHTATSLINWKEAGITQEELLTWWAKHKEEDRKRKLKEQQAARARREVQSALDKLTDAEKKLLGLK